MPCRQDKRSGLPTRLDCVSRVGESVIPRSNSVSRSYVAPIAARLSEEHRAWQHSTVERQFSDDAVAALVAQFDGTGPADPVAAVDFCNSLESWLSTRVAEGAAGSLDDRRWADLWFMRGVQCQMEGDADATDLLKRSIACSKRAGYPRREILGLRALAVCFEQAGNPADSTRSIFEALDRAKELGEDLALARVMHTITMLHHTQGTYAHMLESALRTCHIAKRAGDRSLLRRVYCSVGIAYSRLGRADEGFDWIDRADALPSSPDQPLIQTYISLNRMLLLRFAGRLDEAAVLAKQQEGAGALMSSVDAARVAIDIAGIYLSVGKLDEAGDMLRRAAPRSPTEQTAAHLIEYYATAAKLYKARGDAPKALDMLERQVELDGKTRGAEAQARLIGLERRLARELVAKTEEIHHLRTVELVNKNQLLSDLIRQNEEILHVIVHDLRNPLAATLLLGDSLLLDLQDSVDADSLERLEFIKVATIEMRETIDKLVVSAAPGGGEDPTPASAAARRAVAQVSARSAERGVTIDGSIRDVDLLVDGALLRRCLEDVLWNAIETTRRGSVVKVEVDPTNSGATITISGDVTFDDHDFGARSLYIARRLIERMNGSITLSLAADETRHIATIDLRG